MISGNYSTIVGPGKKEVIPAVMRALMETSASPLRQISQLPATVPSPGLKIQATSGSLVESTTGPTGIDIISMTSGNMTSALINGPGRQATAAWTNREFTRASASSAARIIRAGVPVV